MKRNILISKQNTVGKYVGLRTYQHPGTEHSECQTRVMSITQILDK